MYLEKSKLGSTTRVRIVEKRLEYGVWKKKLIRHIGTAKSDTDLEFLMEKAQETLLELKHKDQLMLPFPDDSSLSGLRTVGEYHQGAELVLGGLFDRLGIPLANVALLRQLIMARILHPVSKRRTAQFINTSFGAGLDEEKIYRFMDSISKSQSNILDKARGYVTSCYPGSFGYILYDVTTLYFETDSEDEDQYGVAGFRKRGYSKDKRDDLLTELVRVSSQVIALMVNVSSKVSTYARRQSLTRSRLIDGSIDRIVNHDRRPLRTLSAA